MARILIADDDPLVHEVFGRAFRRSGHTVYTVYDGIDVLPVLRASNIDCLVLDCLMPGVTGIEVLRKLRSSEKYCLLPVIMLTARTAPNDRQAAINSRVDLYYTKHSDPDWLVFQAEDLIEHKTGIAPVARDPWWEAAGPLYRV